MYVGLSTTSPHLVHVNSSTAEVSQFAGTLTVYSPIAWPSAGATTGASSAPQMVHTLTIVPASVHVGATGYVASKL